MSESVARGIQEHCQGLFRPEEARYEVTLHPTTIQKRDEKIFTLADRTENILRIAERIAGLSRSDRPLTILSLGGDGTFQIVVSGYLAFLFGGIDVLPSLELGAMVMSLKSCKIRLGIVPTGAANDLSDLYRAPRPKPKAVARYLAEAVNANLHLGMALVHGKEGREAWPFVHSFAAGHVFTPVLVDAMAGGRRGKEAMRWMLRHGVGRIFGKTEKRILHWKRSDGTGGEMPAQDSMAHALPRLAVAVALPGLQPFDGIGFKTVPETGLAARLRIGMELFGSGILSRMGRLMPLSAGARLAAVPESHQRTLDVGEWIEFFYTDPEGHPSEIGYQVSGDGIGYTKGPIRISALPAIEYFLMMPGAPIGRLLYQNVVGHAPS